MQPKAGMTPSFVTASLEFDSGSKSSARYMTNDFATGRRDKAERKHEQGPMSCSSCGKVLVGDSQFCHACGKPCSKKEIAIHVEGLQEKAGGKITTLTPRQFTPASTPINIPTAAKLSDFERPKSTSDQDGDDDTSSLLSVPLSTAKQAARPLQLPPTDVFFVHCSACSKFVQLCAEDVNSLLAQHCQGRPIEPTYTADDGREVPQVSSDDRLTIHCNRCLHLNVLTGRAFNKLMVDQMVTNIQIERECSSDGPMRRTRDAIRRSSRSPPRSSESPGRLRRQKGANADASTHNGKPIKPFDRERNGDPEEDYIFAQNGEIGLRLSSSYRRPLSRASSPTFSQRPSSPSVTHFLFFCDISCSLRGLVGVSTCGVLGPSCRA